MKTATLLLCTLVSVVAFGQSAPVPKAPSSLCIDNECQPAEPSSAKYTIFDDFDSTPLKTTLNTGVDSAVWNIELDGGADTYVKVSSDVALSGTRSIKSVITRDSAADFRAEFRHRIGKPSGASVWNRDIWYGFAIFLPADFATSSGRDILFQGHSFNWLEVPAETGTAPTFGIQVRNGNWEIIRRPNVAQPSTRATQESYTTLIGPYIKGIWNRWVCRVRWHWVNGQSQCWLNGKEVYNVNGANAPNDVNAPYFLLGDYRVANKTSAGEPGVSTRVLYYDNVRVMFEGGSYDAVKP